MTIVNELKQLKEKWDNKIFEIDQGILKWWIELCAIAENNKNAEVKVTFDENGLSVKTDPQEIKEKEETKPVKKLSHKDIMINSLTDSISKKEEEIKALNGKLTTNKYKIEDLNKIILYKEEIIRNLEKELKSKENEIKRYEKLMNDF